jgi:hypothetical protein
MASKFYLHASTTGVGGTLPASNATVSATTPTQIVSGTNRSMNAQPSLIGRWVSGLIAAQTISSQQIDVQLANSESAGQSNFQVTYSLVVWRPSDGSVVGRIRDLQHSGTEPSTSEVNVNISNGGTSTSVTSQDGDVLILEIWRDSTTQTNSTARTNTIYYDGTTEGSNTNNAAYVNFANTISMYNPNKTGDASLTVDTVEAATGRQTYVSTAAVSLDNTKITPFTNQALTQFRTAAITTSPTPATTGIVTDSGTASITVNPTVASSGFVTDIGGTLLVLFPQFNIHYATAGNSSKPVTATVTVGTTPASSGRVSSSRTASVTTSPTPAATGATTKPVTAASGASYTVAASADITKAATFELWENGSFVASLGTQNVSISGSVFEFDITPYVTSLADQTGANVELRMTASSASIRVDAVEWEGWAETLGFVTHEGDADLTVAPIPAAAGYVTKHAYASAPADPSNLIPNPSFEDRNLPLGAGGTGWYANGNPSVARTETDSEFGVASLLVNSGSNQWSGAYYEPISVSENTIYTFSAYINVPVGQASQLLAVGVHHLDSGNGIIGQSWSASVNYTASGSFQRDHISFTTQPGTTHVRLYVIDITNVTTPVGTFLVDGVKFELGQPDTSFVPAITTPAATAASNKSVTAAVTVAPAVAASLSDITDTGSASLTVAPTVAAAGATSKPVTAAVTTSPTVAAAGLVTDTATASITVDTVEAAAGFVTDYGTASLTVTPTVTAALSDITDTATATVAAPYTVAAAGFVTDYGTASLTVAPIPAATGGDITDTATATLTAAYAVAASGLVTDTASASLTTDPAPVATGLVTDYGTSSLTVDPTPAATGVTTMIYEGDAALTLDPTPAASGTSSKPVTAAVTTSPIPAASANQVLYSTTATTTSPQVAAAGTVTKPVSAATSSSPAVAAAGFDTQYGTASVTTTPAVAATLSEITDTGSASTTVQYAVAATLSPITDTATADTTITYTVAAAGLVTDSASASLTVDTTQTASGTSSKPVTAATSTTPIPAASATQVQYATAALTSDPAVTTAGTSSKPLVAGTTTVDPIPAAAGLVTSTRTASLIVDPIPAASGTVLKSVTAAVTVLPTVTAASGGTTKPGSAAHTVPIIPIATAGGSDKSVTAETTLVDPQPWAEGIVWRSMFIRPDALLSMSGLTGSYTDIQDSPNSPDANKLVPTGGAIDVRMSFEDEGQILREETGDQILRILMTVPS